MYRIVIILMVCISTLYVNAKVTEEPPRNDFQQRLKNLDSDQKQGVLELAVYKADVDKNAEVKNLSHWFCMSSSFEGMESEKKALRKLKEESCDEAKHAQPELVQEEFSMCDAFEVAKVLEDNCVEGLLFAECRAVTMYTSEFYSTYNTNTRNGHWEPYRVYTTLLYSALLKLDKLDPIPPNTKLYRGMKRKFKVPGSNRFYFKHFVSTSMDKEVAEIFGTETFINIVHDAPIIAAKIQNLSVYPMEEEVLISPFEAFEFIGQNGSQLYFKSAKKQDLINNDELECADDPHSSSNKNKKDHFTIKLGSDASTPPMAAGVGVFFVLLISYLLFF